MVKRLTATPFEKAVERRRQREIKGEADIYTQAYRYLKQRAPQVKELQEQYGHQATEAWNLGVDISQGRWASAAYRALNFPRSYRKFQWNRRPYSMSGFLR